MSSLMNVSNLIGGVVNIPVSKNSVEAACWDITLGTAGTGLGQYILEKTSSSPEMVPEAMDHVGVIVYGYLYEYGDQGILKTLSPLQSDPVSKYPVFYLRSRDNVGDTEVTQEEFEAWVAEMNATDFQGSCYDVVSRSCIVWGMRACEFLGVPYPENWNKICDWAAENEKVAGMIGRSGVRSRQVQFRAQAAETPKKVANYIKRKVKRVKKKFSHSESEGDGAVQNAGVEEVEEETDDDEEEVVEDDDDDDVNDEATAPELPEIPEETPSDDAAIKVIDKAISGGEEITRM